MKDFRVQVRLYNNQLRTRREALGMSGPKFAEVVGVNYGSYAALEAMRDFPLLKTGQWSKTAQKIADFFKCLPEDLFTRAHSTVKKRIAEIELSAAEVARLTPESFVAVLPDTGTAADLNLLSGDVQRVLATLSPQERDVIERRYGLRGDKETLGVIGDLYERSGHRIQQIERQAIRKLRHPSRARVLRPHVEGEHSTAMDDVRAQRAGLDAPAEYKDDKEYRLRETAVRQKQSADAAAADAAEIRRWEASVLRKKCEDAIADIQRRGTP